MDYQGTEMGSLFPSGIKRHVKDKRMSKAAKLNVSLASKIKTKIINNSSIFKISLKHNNRALAQALSREKENSRRMATEKMLLQREVEKLNFENTFLRLKLNNLNKKLIEIEAHLNNSLITAIEMSNFSEFHQSPFLPPASKNKRVSKQCMSMRLPFARVPLTSNDDDDDEDKEKMQHDNNFISKTSSDVPTLVSTRQSLSAQYNLELCLKENNQNVCCLDDSEQISSIIDILPKENCSHYEQSSKSSLMSEMKNSQPISHKKEIPSFNNITKRKKLASFLESNNPCPDNPYMTDLNQEGILSPELNGNNNINDHTNERNIKMQRNIQCLPDSSESASEPATECMNQVKGNDDFQEQKTVYDTDMDLTASEEVSQIVTVSKGTKNKRNNKPNDCATKTFRKVKDSSSEKKRERAKRQIKNSSEMNVEEKIENEPEKRPVGLNDSGDSEDPNSIFSTEQLTQLNKLKTITLHNDFDQDDRQSTENGKKKKKKKKRIHVTNEQEETYSFSQNSDKFQQESKLDMDLTSLAYDKNKASRQTFVIHKLEKGHLFLNQKDQETTSENLEITSEFQTADLATKHNGNLCEYETQNTLDLKKHVTDAQSAQQHESKVIKKLRQKVNRKTEIISEMNQIHGDNDQDVLCPEKGYFSIHTQADKEIISGNLEVSNEFQKPALHTNNNGSLCGCEPQNVLDLQKLVTEAFPVQQNKSKASNLRQRVNRKTVVISEENHLCEDKNVYCPENDNPFCLTQKNKEIIPENLDDASEFQTPALSTKVDRNLSDCETQNILEVKKHANDTQTAGQKESKIDKLRKKVCRKTEIISENLVHENDDKDTHDPEKGNLFSLTQKDNKIIPENLEDSNDFQIVDPSPRGNRNLCYETGNLYCEKKQATKMLPAKPNESKINKRLRDKGSRKTEIILETNQISEFNKGVHDPENGNFFSPTQRDKETISVNPEVTNEFQSAYLSTKDNGNLYDYKNLNMLDLKRYVTDIQPAQQNVSKINRQKVNRKTETISEAYQIYRDNDKDVHGQESYTKDLDFKIHESKQRLECQGIISEYCMEINSDEKENCEQISNPYKQTKNGKESSGKTKDILAKNKKSIFQLTDSSQTSVSLESDLKQVANEADSDSSNQMGAHKNPKQSTTTFNKKSDIPFAEVMKGECQIKRRSKMTSKSKKRKTLIDPSPDSHEAMHIISDTSQRMPVGSEQADEQNLENEKTKPDFYTKMFKSLSQIYSPNVQDSSHNSVHEGSRPWRSSSKNMMIKKNVTLESSPVCAVSDDVQEEMAGMTFQVTQRTQRSGAGGRTLQDLTNTNFVSNNTATSENKSEDLILELPKRRRCTPLNLKEPSLKDKMRR